MVKKMKNVLLFLLAFNLNSNNLSTEGKTVEADQSMVVSRHYLASKVGNEVLINGGNAVDASIAISFALSVVLPQASPIGGGGFMIIHDAKSGNNYALDYREMAPIAATEDMFIVDGEVDRGLALESYLSSGTPGTVHGLYMAHQRFGTLPWNELVKPAIDLAENGFIVTNTLAESLNKETNRRKLSKTSDGKKIFFRDNEPLREGMILFQKDLAKTLTYVSKYGSYGFYNGTVAQKIHSDMKKNNGLISISDLKNYEAKFREPIEFTYKDIKIVTMPPPSSGGLLLALMFNMLENINLDKSNPHTAKNILKISEIMQIAYSLRSIHLADPDFYPVPGDSFLNKNIAKELLLNVNNFQTSRSEHFNPNGLKIKENTTHYSVVDKYGNAVSTTTTLNTAYGSGIIIKGTGLLMNNEMDDFSAAPNQPNYFELLGNEANKIEPLKRPLSSMTPTIVFKDDKPIIVTGAQGGSRIITAVLQIILNYYEFGLTAEESVHLYRYHHQWKPETLMYEIFDEELMNELIEMGFNLQQRPPDYDYSNGITSSIMIEGDKLIGVSDPRSGDYMAIGISNKK
tara:strand:+ start:4482 stop:6197 length:1716 start_codon:yes stop_codon:yes gene_type:complete